MEIRDEKVILRDFIETDIDDRIYWETVETEWKSWDAPWEYDSGEEPFDAEQYRKKMLDRLSEDKDEKRIRSGFQICINDCCETHIGWCNAYRIDSDYNYARGEGFCTIGINIPTVSARRRGYATAAWKLFIEYLISSGISEIYTQTWSGNERLLGLASKLGFEECGRELGPRQVRGKRYDALTLRLNMDKFNGFVANCTI
jgi:RimJ/RimL family protein N-acetyltransferase